MQGVQSSIKKLRLLGFVESAYIPALNRVLSLYSQLDIGCPKLGPLVLDWRCNFVFQGLHVIFLLQDIRRHCCGRRGLHLQVQDYIRGGGGCSRRSFYLPASALRWSIPNLGQWHARCCLWRTQGLGLQVLGSHHILMALLLTWLY
jgi:hypothetical protein